jgi:hypothetical protein
VRYIQKIPGRVFILAVAISATALLAPQVAQAQGAITYLSNMIEPSIGNFPVGSNSWLAAEFDTGNNASGYLLNSVQLRMTDSGANRSNFTAMIYTGVGFDGAVPGSSLGTLDGSLNPVFTAAYTYADDSNITLSPNSSYFIVLSEGTAVVNGAYQLSHAFFNSYNPSGGWGVPPGVSSGVFRSGDGSSWNSISATYLQFAINATALPEPSSEILLGLGAALFGLVRWKAK